MQANDSAGEQLENLALQRMRAGAVLAPLVQHDCARRGLDKNLGARGSRSLHERGNSFVGVDLDPI